jgi:hypothetical protein
MLALYYLLLVIGVTALDYYTTTKNKRIPIHYLFCINLLTWYITLSIIIARLIRRRKK